MTDPHATSSKTERLRDTAEGFCKAFVAGEPPSRILDQFFTRDAKILEHGPAWAQQRLRFLGISFQGRRNTGTKIANAGQPTLDEYYERLTAVLAFHPDKHTVPPKDEFLVDGTKGTVTVKLHARFSSIQTGKSWEEEFVYILSDFDEQGKIGSQELWADPLSAWMAVQEE